MAVYFRHFDDRRRNDRMQPFMKHEQIASMLDERAQVAFGFEVQPACEAGQHHPQHEHVGDLVVMPDGSLPARVPWQIDGPHDRSRCVKLQCKIGLAVMAIGRVLQLQRTDDVQARRRVRLDAMHGADVHLRRFAVGASQRQAAPFVDHDAVRVQRRHLALRVKFRHLREQRQHQHEHVVGRQRRAGLRGNQRTQRARRTVGDPVVHASFSSASCRL
ncbi:hypothetical protein [Burkholderia cepacia]|uniref:hypothetical protein n=1 Tax=Burkholderia cepacia TaxID=292 RepID=UPI001E31E6A7|nr:hypothetical protein [Burkholderia cepacia]